jgi:solute carrier family 45 protein 1/2/4
VFFSRRKTRSELVRISAAVMGIEFSYAAETAFVSPILLKIGVQHEYMTLVWALPPLIGFFVTPILGSLSDRCHLSWGRRRPFILILAVGILTGAAVVLETVVRLETWMCTFL